MFAFLFGFGLLAYMQQKSITVAAERMMPELGLSQVAIGWLEQAFVVGYGLFQMPGGIFGQRFGARRTFVIIGLAACIAMIATSAGPTFVGGRVLFAELLGAQALLGIAQAAIFPVSAGAFESWFPPGRWAFVQGLQTMGLQLGAAMTPPLIATLMHAFGWQRALFWTTLPAIGLIALWAWYARDTPREHPAMTPGELGGNRRSAGGDDRCVDRRRPIAAHTARSQRSAAGGFLSLHELRVLPARELGVPVLDPGTPLLRPGERLARERTAARRGFRRGLGRCAHGNRLQTIRDSRRLSARAADRVAGRGLLLLFAVNCANPYLAVGALALCYGCVELNEGAFWSAAMTVGRGDTMAVSGFMNTGGNLGGIIGIPIIAFLSGHHEWRAAFLIGAASAFASALAWLGIDVERPGS